MSACQFCGAKPVGTQFMCPGWYAPTCKACAQIDRTLYLYDGTHYVVRKGDAR